MLKTKCIFLISKVKKIDIKNLVIRHILFLFLNNVIYLYTDFINLFLKNVMKDF